MPGFFRYEGFRCNAGGRWEERYDDYVRWCYSVGIQPANVLVWAAVLEKISG